MYETFVPRKEHKFIGTFRPKIDAKEKALGRITYFDDLTLKGKFPTMIHCKILNSPYANATILKMDTRRAEKLPGVYAVLRFDDPEITALGKTTHAWTDQAVTPYHRDTIPRYWDRRFLSNTARWVGDQMGVAVAAETEEIAEEALKQIVFEWDVRSPFLEVEESKSDQATILHPELNPESNQLPHHDPCENDIAFHKGDVDKAFGEADVKIEIKETFGGNSTHGCLDYRGCLIDWKDDKLTVWTNHYYNDQTRMYLHSHLKLPLSKIRVINCNNGGHFGKWNMGEDVFFVITALLAKKCGRPVKYKMTNQEEFHDGRNMTTWGIKLASKKDGTITGMDLFGVGNSGAYFGGAEYNCEFIIKENVHRIFSCIPNIRLKDTVYFTNRLPGGIMRGIAHVQIAFAISQAIDVLSEKLEMDPIELIIKNFGDEWLPHPSESLTAVLKKGAEKIGWESRHKAGEGECLDGYKKRGMGVGFNNLWHAEWQETVRGRIEVSIRVNPDLSVILNAPTNECGNGSNSACVFACAEALKFLNIKPEDITWASSHNDTEMGLKDCPPTDSIVSVIMPEAIHETADKIKAEFCSRAAIMLGYDKEDLDVEDARVFLKRDPEIGMPARDVMMEDDCVPIHAHTARGNNKEVTGIAFGAWFAEVEVDIDTGKVEVLQLVIVSDVGQVMHASGAESQQLGGQCFGIGEGLMEEIAYDKATGTPLNFNYIDYKMPTMMDYPSIDPVLLEVWKGAGEYGAFGLGETTFAGTAAAIANAIYNAAGIRMWDVPMKPEKVLKALEQLKQDTIEGVKRYEIV